MNNPWISCWYVCSRPLEEFLRVFDHQLAAVEAGWCTKGSCCCTVWRQRLYLWSGVVAARSLGGPRRTCAAGMCLFAEGHVPALSKGCTAVPVCGVFAAAVCTIYCRPEEVCVLAGTGAVGRQVLPWGCTVHTVLSAAVGWALLLRVCGPCFGCLSPDMGRCGCAFAMWPRLPRGSAWARRQCICLDIGVSHMRVYIIRVFGPVLCA